ncbi:MAG: hypothetical protein ABS81_07790 [Pseudonocardia sp. SCN 72-86]|nr:MAG: hypothetical protein ABS81_07790 [Pseudonocardia sp. SCN 72-86]
MRLDLGDAPAGQREDLTAAQCRHDELGATVGRIAAAFEVALGLQVVDELGAGGEAQLGAVGERGEPDAVDTDVAEDVQVRLSDIGIVDVLISKSAPPEAVALVRAAFLGGDRIGMQRVMRWMMLDRADLRDRLPRITAPTLLVAGADDETWTPDQARQAVTALPHGRVLVMDGTGHIPPLERPDETVAAILDLWQAGVSPPARGTPAGSPRADA